MRRARKILAALNLPQSTHECDGCGTVRHGDGNIPVGWATHAGVAWCSDCCALGIPQRVVGRSQRRKRAANATAEVVAA